MKRLLPFIAILLLFASCSPQKRLNNLLDNNPELTRDTTYRDTTVVKRDTVKVDTSFERAEAPEFDSLFAEYTDSLSSPKDSVVIREIQTRVEETVRKAPLFKEDTVKKSSQGFVISLFENPDRTVGVRVEHTPPPDTVRTEVKVEEPVKTEKVVPDHYKIFAWIGGILIGLFALYIIIRAIKGGTIF